MQGLAQHWPIAILPLLWLLACLALGRGAVLVWRSAGPWQRIGALSLTLLAATLRGLLSPRGWSDQNNLLSDGLLTPLHELPPSPYGSAIDALTATLHYATPLSERFIEWLNLTAGAMTPIALVVALHLLAERRPEGSRPPTDDAQLRTHRVAAWSAGLVLACTPLHIRFSFMVGRYPALLLLAVLAIAVFSAFLSGLITPRREPTVVAGGVSALVLAVQTRPEAAWLVFAVASLGLVHRVRAPRLIALVALGAALLIPHAMRLFATIEDGAGLSDFDASHALLRRLSGVAAPEHNLLLTDTFTPSTWAVLAFVGLFWAVMRRDRSALWWACWAGLGTAVVSPVAIEGSLFNARYHMIPMLFFTPLIGFGVGALLERLLMGRRWLKRLALEPRGQRRHVVAGVLVVAAALPAVPLMGYANRVTANEAEVRFLRAAAQRLPHGCVIYFFEPQHQDLGLRPRPSLSTCGDKRHRWLPSAFLARRRQRPTCAAIYRGSACLAKPGWPESRAEQKAECGRLRARMGAAIAEATLPSDTGEPVPRRLGANRVGLYWVAWPEPSAGSM